VSRENLNGMQRAILKHFSDADWADFARKLVSRSIHMAMHKHLDEGCEQCAATLRTWESVGAVAGHEAALTPPDHVVRVVKSFTAATKASPGVRLVFDSDLQPAAAGVRGAVSARQLLYQTDDYFIDLRLEPRRESDRACLVGQVMPRTGDTVARGVAVGLKTGNLRLAETTANQFGEFQFDFDAVSNMCISIKQDRDTEILLPICGTEAKPLKQKQLD
jgi:hypothetical protein